MTIFFFVVFGFYFSIVIGLIVGWQLLLEGSAKKVQSNRNLRLSVIVPYRNEAANLSMVLRSLVEQEYPEEFVEFVLINDHSTDQSEEIVEEFAKKYSNIKWDRLPQEQFGKKRAIALGIALASNEIIVATDADCLFSSQWLSCINQAFCSDNCMMAIGAVRIEPGVKFFPQLQSLEFASLIGSTGATVFYEQPTMANGANLAFRKNVFVEVNGFEGNWEIPSGDDEFLLRKIHSKYPGGINFLTDRHSVVSTQPLLSVRDFVQQRIRWAGKWRFNTSMISKTLAVFVFFFQASYIGLGLTTYLGWIPVNSFMFLLTLKFLFEFVFLYQVSVFLDIKWRWFAFFVLQLVYSIYVIWVALLAQRQSFTWKDRVVKSKHSG
ncbi:MAG: glycosyltransferase [Cyclobacteriaceae bacterium]|nr:glycosyltransferase [Cyclobacteriaceae bacterium]